MQSLLKGKAADALATIDDTFEFKGNKVVEIKQTAAVFGNSQKAHPTKPFKFDRVFKPTDNQISVFEEVREVVRSALDGYNVCIFAYG